MDPNINKELLATLFKDNPELISQVGDIMAAKQGHVEMWLGKFITADPAMLVVKDCVRKLAPLHDSVLIQGPTGTGKELLANALHGSRTGKFVAINCASMPEQLLESELFGHKRGAFTGAVSDNPGLMVAAKDGTLFLDEIGEMPLHIQAKLLRVLQEQEVRPVGGQQSMKINCRVVAATNRGLLNSGAFRQDLYWRISTFFLETTPLCERREDIMLLVSSLISSPELSVTPLQEFFNTLPKLAGNVREVQQVVRRFEVFGSVLI